MGGYFPRELRQNVSPQMPFHLVEAIGVVMAILIWPKFKVPEQAGDAQTEARVPAWLFPNHYRFARRSTQRTAPRARIVLPPRTARSTHTRPNDASPTSDNCSRFAM